VTQPVAVAPSWCATERVLLHGGTIYSPVSPFATAMLVDGGVIAWLGEDSAADAHRDAADRVVDLRGRLVTPGFVDAHVHTTGTGLTLTGLDLTGCTSLNDALQRLEAAARALRGGVILGHGWEETDWPEGRAPTRAEVDRASWGSVAYLSRIDVHSAVVSSALLAMVPQARGLAGFSDEGPLTQAAHHAVREAALASIRSAQRRDAQRAARAHAAAQGIVAMHEMAGPNISSEDDLADLVALAVQEPGPVVSGYWGELAQQGGIDRARQAGAFAVGGDLSVDGALGSRTACLTDPYRDASTTGAQYLTAAEITDHVIATTHAGMQAGFHVIGDGACRAVVDGLSAAARAVGAEQFRRLGHRLEHAEMLAADHIDALAELGVTARLWGSSGGMYEQRLGADRAASMNRIGDLVAAGVLVAFGSDSPVTPLGPWAAVRAAVHHHQSRQRVSARAAFSAHTRSGWRAVGQPDAGTLAPGAPAHYAVWDVAEVVVEAPDARLAAWSTDPRSGTPGLPSLAPHMPLPVCRRTAIHGRVVFDDLEE
jgi:predicted amidohydrolase YtcJ